MSALIVDSYAPSSTVAALTSRSSLLSSPASNTPSNNLNNGSGTVSVCVSSGEVSRNVSSNNVATVVLRRGRTSVDGGDVSTLQLQQHHQQQQQPAVRPVPPPRCLAEEIIRRVSDNINVVRCGDGAEIAARQQDAAREREAKKNYIEDCKRQKRREQQQAQAQPQTTTMNGGALVVVGAADGRNSRSLGTSSKTQQQQQQQQRQQQQRHMQAPQVLSPNHVSPNMSSFLASGSNNNSGLDVTKDGLPKIRCMSGVGINSTSQRSSSADDFVKPAGGMGLFRCNSGSGRANFMVVSNGTLSSGGGANNTRKQQSDGSVQLQQLQRSASSYVPGAAAYPFIQQVNNTFAATSTASSSSAISLNLEQNSGVTGSIVMPSLYGVSVASSSLATLNIVDAALQRSNINADAQCRSRYRRLQLLGRGAHGETWLVEWMPPLDQQRKEDAAAATRGRDTDPGSFSSVSNPAVPSRGGDSSGARAGSPLMRRMSILSTAAGGGELLPDGERGTAVPPAPVSSLACTKPLVKMADGRQVSRDVLYVMKEDFDTLRLRQEAEKKELQQQQQAKAAAAAQQEQQKKLQQQQLLVQQQQQQQQQSGSLGNTMQGAALRNNRRQSTVARSSASDSQREEESNKCEDNYRTRSSNSSNESSNQNPNPVPFAIGNNSASDGQAMTTVAEALAITPPPELGIGQSDALRKLINKVNEEQQQQQQGANGSDTLNRKRQKSFNTSSGSNENDDDNNTAVHNNTALTNADSPNKNSNGSSGSPPRTRLRRFGHRRRTSDTSVGSADSCGSLGVSDDEAGNSSPNGMLRLKDFAEISYRRPAPLTRSNGASDETLILANCAHPCLVGFVDDFVDTDGKTRCLVMEYVDNGDLRGEIIRRKQNGSCFGEASALFLFAQICCGVEYLHRHNVLHRDLKTANILLSKRWSCKICDAGFAVHTQYDVDGKLDLSPCGSPYYLSPEIFLRHPYGEKSDVWSLAVILFEMLTSRRPFESQNVDQLAQDIVYTKHRPLGRPGMSEGVVDLINRMLSKNPDDRPNVKQVLQHAVVRPSLIEFVAKFERAAQASNNHLDETWAMVLKEHVELILSDDGLSSPKSAKMLRGKRRQQIGAEMKIEAQLLLHVQKEVERSGVMAMTAVGSPASTVRAPFPAQQQQQAAGGGGTGAAAANAGGAIRAMSPNSILDTRVRNMMMSDDSACSSPTAERMTPGPVFTFARGLDE